MKSKAKRATKAEQERMAKIKEIGCVACNQCEFHAMAISGIEVHHLLSGNRRKGHAFTIALCKWHHRGEHDYWTATVATEYLGPSLARSSKAFHAAFGSDDELLERTNKLLEKSND